MTSGDPPADGHGSSARLPADKHPRFTLDEVIHSPVRLSIMATLDRVGEIDFGALREIVEVSDSLLSKHVKLLEDRGYVTVVKGYLGRRPRTWFSLTDAGRDAFARYRISLGDILGSQPAARSGSAS